MKTEFINGFQRNYLKVALTETGGEKASLSVPDRHDKKTGGISARDAACQQRREQPLL